MRQGVPHPMQIRAIKVAVMQFLGSGDDLVILTGVQKSGKTLVQLQLGCQTILKERSNIGNRAIRSMARDYSVEISLCMGLGTGRVA